MRYRILQILFIPCLMAACRPTVGVDSDRKLPVLTVVRLPDGAVPFKRVDLGKGQPVTAGKEFKFEGTYQLAEGIEHPILKMPRVVIVNQGDERNIIVMSGFGELVKHERGRKYSYQGKVRAPEKPGRYILKLQIRPDDLLSKTLIEVKK